MMFPGWTEDTEARLVQGVKAGLSARAVALKLGKGCTRSAVLGKAHRLGIAFRGEPENRAELRRVRTLKRRQAKAIRASVASHEYGSPSPPRRFSWEQPLDPGAERA